MLPFSSQKSFARLILCAVGICLSYLFYGMIQERLFLGSERLGAAFLVAGQSATNCLMAWVCIYLSPRKATADSGQLNHVLLLSTSFCYVVAMTASNEALNFVRYPTAVLCKSCKLIPTMLVGSCMEGTSYGLYDWSAAALMTAGIVQFHLEQFMSERSKTRDDRHDTLTGLILLFLSLGFDGLLGACQGLLKRKKSIKYPFRPPTAMETMLYMNLYALLFLVPWSIVVGQWSHAMSVLLPLFSVAQVGSTRRHFELLWGMLGLNATAAVGQLFIFWTITWYSPLMCTTITTTRKFITIVISVFYFGHILSSRQWLAVMMVFSGLYLSILQEASESSSRNKRRANSIKTD